MLTHFLQGSSCISRSVRELDQYQLNVPKILLTHFFCNLVERYYKMNLVDQALPLPKEKKSIKPTPCSLHIKCSKINPQVTYLRLINVFHNQFFCTSSRSCHPSVNFTLSPVQYCVLLCTTLG